MKQQITEFIGTFFLVLVITLSGNALAVGFILAVMVYIGAYISGAHYNPAVTLGVYLRKAIDKKTAIRYVVAQLAGGVAAAFISYLVTGVAKTPQPAVDVTFLSVLLLEFVFTFALVFTVLNVATTKATKGNQYFGIAIGGVVLAGVYAIGPITGGVMNPAVAFGTILIDIPNIASNLFNLILYIVGPCLGGAIAAHVYLQQKELEEKKG